MLHFQGPVCILDLLMTKLEGSTVHGRLVSHLATSQIGYFAASLQSSNANNSRPKVAVTSTACCCNMPFYTLHQMQIAANGLNNLAVLFSQALLGGLLQDHSSWLFWTSHRPGYAAT